MERKKIKILTAIGGSMLMLGIGLRHVATRQNECRLKTCLHDDLTAWNDFQKNRIQHKLMDAMISGSPVSNWESLRAQMRELASVPDDSRGTRCESQARFGLRFFDPHGFVKIQTQCSDLEAAAESAKESYTEIKQKWPKVINGFNEDMQVVCRLKRLSDRLESIDGRLASRCPADKKSCVQKTYQKSQQLKDEASRQWTENQDKFIKKWGEASREELKCVP